MFPMDCMQFSRLQRTLTIFLSCSRLLWWYLWLLTITNLLGHKCLVETLPSSLPPSGSAEAARLCPVCGVCAHFLPLCHWPSLVSIPCGVVGSWRTGIIKLDWDASTTTTYLQGFYSVSLTSVSLRIFPNLSSRDRLVLRGKWGDVRKVCSVVLA